MVQTQSGRSIIGMIVNAKTIVAAVVFIAGAFVGGSLVGDEGGKDADRQRVTIEHCLPLQTAEQLAACLGGAK
ncbi:hypothetical protein LK459_07560 [Gordonia otitidis]|uniref:hypothetical protein n=1 Tax=Gordonia otitidis TaxID=249058 RepID=UPI001D151059|nr:hypothetical protein [Gordonia otitidis]UEA60679.1 hypothetical protein LK459_07560 [Gordonia otitidis]